MLFPMKDEIAMSANPCLAKDMLDSRSGTLMPMASRVIPTICGGITSDVLISDAIHAIMKARPKIHRTEMIKVRMWRF